MAAESWRPVVGMESSHEVSDAGRIRALGSTDALGRRIHGRVLTNGRMSGRYVRVRLTHHGKHVERAIHILVLEAFVGPRPPGADACHGDGDRWNNRLDNLRWDSHAANQRDKITHGTIARGARNGWAKLTEADVRALRDMVAAGATVKDAAQAFGISDTHASQIVRRVRWGHVQ